MADFSDKYDLVLVFPWSEDDSNKKKPHVIEAVRRISEAKFETFTYLSVQKDELIILMRAPLKVLQAYADEIDFKVRLDPVAIKRTCEAGDSAAKIKPFTINDGPEYCIYSPYDYIYGRYETSIDQSIYMKSEGDQLFHPTTKFKLLYYLLQANHSVGGCSLNLTKLLKKQRLLAIFPLQNKEITKDLSRNWIALDVMPWNQPLDDIKDYFGEKIALYFAFMSNYTSWLILPAIVGLAFQLVVWITGNFSHPVLPFFCVLISVWTVLMLESWKREEKLLSLRWGTTDFEEDEPERPQFHGEIIPSFIDGKQITYFPVHEHNSLVAQSTTFITLMIMLVVGCVTSIYILRFHLYSSIGSNASTVASVINAVQITILNITYGMLATYLTVRENHRTDTEYEDSLIAKVFVFQFVNSYTSFYFLAFIAPYLPRPPDLEDTGVEGGFVGECGFDDCMKPLALNLGIIFGTALTVNNILEVGVPIIKNYLKQRAESKGATEEATVPEKQYTLLAYDVMTNNMQDYAEVAVQFGYMTIFIVALPISCLISLFNNFIELKIDGWKLLNVYQRPIPKGAEDIGNWQAVFSLVSVIAIITNAGLICFTMSVLDDFTLSSRIWIFFTFQWLLIVLQQVIAYIIPDEPLDFKIQLRRQAHIVSKVIDKVPDEEDEEDDMDNDDNASKYAAFTVAFQKYPRTEKDALELASIYAKV